MRIRFKLISGFGIITFLVILIGAVTFIQTTQIEHEFRVVETETTPTIIALGNIKSNIFFVTLEVNEYILDPIEEHLEELQEGKEKLGKAMLAYEKAEAGEEKEGIESFKQGITKIISSIDEIINLKDSGASMDILLEKTKMLDEVVEEFSHELEEEIEHDTLQLAESHQSVNDLIQVTNNLTIIIIVISIILSIIITLIFSTSISKPITNLSNATKEIAKGNFKIEINVKGTDELSQLSLDVNQMAIDLEKQQERLVKAEKLYTIGKLASRLSHDLRNPLAVIKGTIDVLKVSIPKEDEIYEKLSRMDDAVFRMNHQIKNVLDYVKQKSTKFEKTSVYKILNSVLDDTEIPENIRIEKIGKDIEIICDSNLMKVVFVNLIVNAIQAIGDKKGEIKIQISDKVKDQIMITVEDNGSDIPDNVLSKIFEPLFTTKQEGTGLGLSSCQSIMQQHNGTISVKNNPTIFTITLPKNLKISEYS